MMKMSCFVVFCVIVIIFVSGCEYYYEIEFPTINVCTTTDMRPWRICPKGNTMEPLYIFCNGKFLKLDTITTADETKFFLKNIGLDYQELLRYEIVYDPVLGREKYEQKRHYISAGVFDFEYKNGKLDTYDIASRSSKMISDVYVGKSLDVLFPVPLEFADIEKMFGHDYKIQKRVYK